MFWVKIRSGDNNNWGTYHHLSNANPEQYALYLDSNSAATDDGFLNDTAPTSSVINLSSGNYGNVNTNTYVSHCWSEVQGYSKFGKYVGNGNANGTFVYTGFRPAFVLFKGLNSNREWILADNKRDPINEVDAVLYANTNDAEGDSDMVDFLSNGFKFIHASGPGTINTSAETYIYMAFAESPFVNSNGVPVNAR
tara:strand:- start:52 stop:636 length:585 start_codon:yes stop_codon:yes gene_type:complete